MKISMMPPITVALSENLSPIFFPKTSPATQIAKVTAPMIADDSKASETLYSDMVNPTESASIEVASH